MKGISSGPWAIHFQYPGIKGKDWLREWSGNHGDGDSEWKVKNRKYAKSTFQLFCLQTCLDEKIKSPPSKRIFPTYEDSLGQGGLLLVSLQQEEAYIKLYIVTNKLNSNHNTTFGFDMIIT